MAIKKSDLYSSLWESCDLLRGGMDASQYKDYVLVLLFIKYVSDKYAGQRYAPITIPEGASFADMVALKGKPDIGDQINKKIVGPLAAANKLSDMPDFNDSGKLGTGAEMVRRLTDLIAVFENPDLDFSKNRADGDDILGDAYEYLMRHFATESGKSKGQFYTPAEVSRIMAQIIGISSTRTSSETTVYDPTCGSGSLLLKVGDAAPTSVTLYGQEKDSATSGLARMNMILHDNPTALIGQGNTLTDPKFRDGDRLKTFDFVVANPPFSDKRWSTGLDPVNDSYGRFDTFGVPPAKQGDYAYLLHIVRSLKSTGKGACILPHGVLFRGNAEAEIRRNLIRYGYIKGIIGLPANLFYGTGIPACIIVVDKEDAQARKGIFMIDASQGFIKDGPKNRLREQDIHRIVDVFNRQDESDPRYARMVSVAEIEKNDFNLNLPRYIDSSVVEDIQDLKGHLHGGIPDADVDALDDYWAICPSLKKTLFKPRTPGYYDLAVDKAAIKSTILQHPQFAAFIEVMGAHFEQWRVRTAQTLKALEPGFHPKQLIVELADGLLNHYEGKPLIDAYDVYQHLMDYWAQTMQDDAYLLASDGWVAKTYRIIETDRKGKEKDKGWTCDLLPKSLIVARYFAAEQKAIDETSAVLEAASSALAELEEEHSGDDQAFAGYEKINAVAVKERMREIGDDADAADELAVLKQWQALADKEAKLRKALRELEAELDAKAYAQYSKLTVPEIKSLVVDDKWLAALYATVSAEVERVSQSLTQRVRELALRYETPLPVLQDDVAALSEKVNGHLLRMGVTWK
ncbi:HsdM family class I SAM-dependent methyltransferase [Burkholderia pseudomallei]|uniref:HsdM family class I SAM-dependent methyltransferase n=1 Tax=Burkholderia pseudomallei TaxID=28450 RepID=UPI000F0715DA|nr:class I SAM-dependent DNA methyltransferase [Burkholderia pseudomallei]VBS86050.1 type I restriction-modification system, M subunit [Burkholderia pseudomallei]